MFGQYPPHLPKTLNLKFNQFYALNRGLFCEKNMAIQTANLGTAPSGAGGDTFRSAATKFNENFTNNAHAASRLVGTQSRNVMEVGAFGVGGNNVFVTPTESVAKGSGFYGWSGLDGGSVGIPSFQMVLNMKWLDGTHAFQLIAGLNHTKDFGFRRWVATNGGTYGNYQKIYSTENTTVDANGFIKKASPIARLFADKIELNDEAKLQNITFEKLTAGDYLIKGSSGFAQEGWYIETPKDANGNVLFSVIYTTLENGDISVKTYKKKFDFETVSIVADLDNPVDITENRWIDLRLQELPQPEIETPESITPPNFQPTGLAEAVATVMESYNDPEQ